MKQMSKPAKRKLELELEIGQILTVNQTVKIILSLVGDDRNKINSMLVGMVDNLQMYVPIHHGADAKSLRAYLTKHQPKVYLGPCGDYMQFNEHSAYIKLSPSMGDSGGYDVQWIKGFINVA